MRYAWMMLCWLILSGASAQAQTGVGLSSDWRTHNYLSQVSQDTATSTIHMGTVPGQKNTFQAFVMSAVVPGAGEWYAGKKWMGVVKTAAEVGFWVAYFHYDDRAEDKRIEYEAYADDHWSFSRWEEWYDDSGWAEIGSETFERHDNGDPVKDHHYYEKLGKYPWAQGGWDDFLPEYQDDNLRTVVHSDHHYNYLEMRLDKNNLNATARNFATASIFNHVISGFHAALIARSHNKALTAMLKNTEVQLALTDNLQPEYRLTFTQSF